MVLAKHLADDTGALAVRAGVRYPHVIYCVQNAAMDGL
jgi:hypothetical protein